MTLGTAVLISSTTLVDGAGADSATITITDPEGDALVNEAAMTDAGSGVFEHIYQSPVGGSPGNYNAKVTAVSGEYSCISNIRFKLEKD